MVAELADQHVYSGFSEAGIWRALIEEARARLAGN